MTMTLLVVLIVGLLLRRGFRHRARGPEPEGIGPARRIPGRPADRDAERAYGDLRAARDHAEGAAVRLP